MKVFAPQNTAVVRLLVMAWLAMAGTGPAEDQPAGINAGGRRILAGDRLNISVREQPDMSRVYAVAGDGSIDFGFAGRVVIAELTSDEAARKLESVLEERYFKEANVTISIANFVEGDVLISGGDPLTMSTEKIEHIIASLRAIDHVEIIRIGTRVPVVMPMRITQ